MDAIICSPPYWKKRDYQNSAQLGQEETPEKFALVLAETVCSWAPLLKPRASLFLNLGDSRRAGAVVPVTTFFECEIRKQGWHLISRIIWSKPQGMPNPHGRLASRHETIFHLARTNDPYLDLFAYGREFSLNDGDVWPIALKPTKNNHLAPFPEELVRRALLLACPERVCCACGAPLLRRVARGMELDPKRPQARRALELWHASNLTPAHLEAIRATGINDAGKSLRFQNGAHKNAIAVQKLAGEAKAVLGGYFREFTFALPQEQGWTPCSCGETQWQSGLVLDPFCGSGTTLRVAAKAGRRSIGIDLTLEYLDLDQTN